MLKQIKLEDTKKGLDRYKFYYKCTFCKVLSDKLRDKSCNFCFRYFNYVQEQHVLLLSFKNIFLDMGRRKFEDKSSCFEFAKLEDKLIKMADQNPCYAYNSNSMIWHIDFEFEDGKQKQLLSIIKTAEDLLEELAKHFSIGHGEKQNLKDDLIVKLDTFDKTKELLLPIVMPEINSAYDSKTPCDSAIIFADRSDVLKNFYENLNFFDVVD